jgi:PAS domain S-box-containing protein
MADPAQAQGATEAARDSGDTHLRQALAAAGAGVWTWNAQDNVVTSDERVRALYGFGADAPRDVAPWLERIHPDDREHLERLMTLPDVGPVTIEFRTVLPGGRIAWRQRIRRVERDAAGQAIRITGVDFDITERKETQLALQAARDALRRRARVREGVLRQRGEQLTRLASVLTLAEQQERERLATVLHDELQQFLVGAKLGLDELRTAVGGRARGEAEARLADLVQRAIEVTRTLVAELHPAMLQEPGLLDGLRWLARWMHDTHGLEVALDVDPSCVIEREDVRLLVFQSIREALFNVVKHAGVQRAGIDAAWADAEHLRIRIHDAGAGFDAKSVARDDGARGGAVVHFGLASIRERLELLGGKVELESAPGDGTRLTLLVPVDGVLLPSMSRRAAAEHAGGALPPVRVLIADGRALTRKSLAALLAARSDIRVVGEASSGHETLALARLLEPDALLLCLTMRGLGGVQTARRVSQEHPALRIIGLVDSGQTGDREAMIKAGAVAVFDAGGNVDSLLRAVRGR